MNSKKLITLLVLTTLLLAMVPFAPFANATLIPGDITVDNDDTAAVNDAEGEKGHDIIVEGDAGSVASGYEVMMYWDKIQSWDGTKGHLNTTEADDDGGFEVWFEVPEAPAGDHYLWFTATDQETKVSVTFKVLPDCDLSTGSGLAGSKVYVDLWGFAKNKDVGLLFIEEGAVGDPATDWNDINDYDDTLALVGDNVKTTFTGAETQAEHYPMTNNFAADPMTITLSVTGPAGTYDGTNFIVAGGANDIVPAGCTINRATGTMTLQFAGAPGVGETCTIQYDAGSFAESGEDLEESYDVDEDKYDGTLDNQMIEPGTFVLSIGANDIDDDDGTAYDGKLFDAADVDVGSINYVTGEWDLDLGDSLVAFVDAAAFTADYEYFDDIENHAYVITTSGLTNSLGTWEDRRISIPEDAQEAQYYVVAMDGKNNVADDDFKIGAVITLGVDEGEVGDIVEVEGEGFPGTTTITCEIWRNNAFVENVHIVGAGPDDNDDVTNGEGEFAFDIVIPSVDKKKDDYEIKCIGGAKDATADFEITGLATVSVTPDFGPQGSTITVSGENFMNIKDKKVKIELSSVPVAEIEDEVKVDSDGSFEVDVTVPTENDDTYDIIVTALDDDDGSFYITDKTEFRIGTIMVLLSKDEGPVGDKIVLTGNGFTDDGEWNATFGDEDLFSEEQASNTGLLKVSGETPEFFVPQLMPGVYTITVWDVEAELTVETEFTVTYYTVLDLELSEAPNEYNLSIEGWYWPELSTPLNNEDEISFLLWNETDEWEMDVRQEGDPGIVAVLNGTGFLNDAWWVVPDDETLSLGDYWINATIETDNDQEYFMQLEFTVGEVHMSISPRKATFRVGDTVSFNVEHTFGNDANQDIKGGDIKVYDPDGNLYWDGDPLETWSKKEQWYEVPYSAQTASDNPMVLLDDAPLGTWEYTWREKGPKRDTITEGTFEVTAAAEEIISEQIEDLNSAIDDLTDDISSVTDAVAGVQSNVNSAIQAANAAVEAANAAVEAVNAVASTAGQAAEAAQNAADAASDAKDAAGGLTTLVYGAIGASLVAALAAIVSLMQISRRIAG